MQVELELRGLEARVEEPIQVNFKRCIVGEYYAGLLVDQKVIVELKVAKQYNPADEAQLLNELKATGTEAGL